MNLIETWMLSLRHKEEIDLVEKEIITYNISIRKKISVLEKERRKLQSGLNKQKMKKTEKGVSVCRRSIARRVSL